MIDIGKLQDAWDLSDREFAKLCGCGARSLRRWKVGGEMPGSTKQLLTCIMLLPSDYRLRMINTLIGVTNGIDG